MLTPTMKPFEEIFANNERWVQAKLALDPHYFRKLAEVQRAELLYIGCSDSRVTAEELMGPSRVRSSSTATWPTSSSPPTTTSTPWCNTRSSTSR
jgi:hypothetical protein